MIRVAYGEYRYKCRQFVIDKISENLEVTSSYANKASENVFDSGFSTDNKKLYRGTIHNSDIFTFKTDLDAEK